MRYLVIGAGGTGGCIGGFLAARGQDVTFIARGEHLHALQQGGLHIHSDLAGKLHLRIPAMSIAQYNKIADSPPTQVNTVLQIDAVTYDIIFVCVKGYSLPDILPLIPLAAHKNTLIIPVLNGLGTGARLAQEFPALKVLEGCMYITAQVTAPGEVTQHGTIFRVVYGPLDDHIPLSDLDAVTQDLTAAGIHAVISSNIRRDTFRKYSFISPMAAAGAFHQATAGQLQQEGDARQTFLALTEEIVTLAQALGISLDIDIQAENDKVLAATQPDVTSSLQKDLAKGGHSEIDGQIFEVVRMAKKAGLTLPMYEKIAESFGFIVSGY